MKHFQLGSSLGIRSPINNGRIIISTNDCEAESFRAFPSASMERELMGDGLLVLDETYS